MIKKIKKISFLVCLMLFGSMSIHAQQVKQKKADKEFEKLAYIDAIKVYETIADKGYVNQSILQKLGDSYYFNAKLVEANKWYTQLFESEYEDKDLSALGSEYYYRYAQSLRAVENYDKADQVMQEFSKMEVDDARSQLYSANKAYRERIAEMPERYQLKNLDINSEYSDYGAALLDNKLVFTSARETQDTRESKRHQWTNESYTSLYASEINPDGSFSEPVKLSKVLDSKVNDATAVFTQDGKTMYFTRNNSKKSGKKKRNKQDDTLLKIYKASLNDQGEWDNVVELPFNSDDFNTAHPALTPDEKWLYFSSDREGTKGASDIFRVSISSQAEYGEVQNIGEGVNTPGRETFPFISSDNLLFFSSDGHPGLGGLDVFVARIYSDGTVSEVTNLGMPINSSLDDFGFYLNTNSGKGFVSSNRQGGKGSDDIYFVSEKACQQQIEGTVYDIKTEKVLSNAMVIISDAMYQQVDTLYTDEKGYYLSELKSCGKKYRLQASKQEYSTVELVLNADRTFGKRTVNVGLDKATEEVTVNDDLFKKLKLQPIYFDFDKSNIRPDAAIELMKVVEVMKLYPNMKVDVRSHTDSRGNDNYNMSLSDRRAKSTVKWMIEQGIDKSRLTGKGYGESQLINKCSNGVPCSIEEHQLNRRSEFIVIEL
ncbi:OmpA family protein [Myroides albus]|uniref:OmpA family protein n=1 Tax=Myroides albus TaxID=2562892 RepID=UPI002159B450|nr:OmpA family protein [Myroides albus]UVD79179.1 OmpA family protein [Myroides albus]